MAISQLKMKRDLSAAELMSEEIADILRENIISRSINPGEKVNEYQVAKLLNISRPPIREAFRLLAAEGLITLVPRKGAFVSKMTPQEVKEIYEMKSMMESFAVRLGIPIVDEKEVSELDSINNLIEEKIKQNDFKAILKLNIEFHRKMIKMSKNEKLAHFYESIVLPIRRYQQVGLSAPASWETSLQEHREIVEAIRSKNIEFVERLSRGHTMKAAARVIKQLEENKDEDSDPKSSLTLA